MIEALQNAKKVYIDTNIIIYYIENNKYPNFSTKLDDFFQLCLNNKIKLFINVIGIAECHFGVHKAKDENLLHNYNAFFYDFSLLTLTLLTNKLILKAAKFGAANNLKLIDAVHFQSAIDKRCSHIITNDLRFKSSHGIEILQLGHENA